MSEFIELSNKLINIDRLEIVVPSGEGSRLYFTGENNSVDVDESFEEIKKIIWS